MADKTIVVRAVYRSNVASGMRQDAGAIQSVSAKVESSAAKSVNSVKAMGAASAVAGKLMVLGIGGAMAVSAKAAIDFESSMAGVAKTTDLTGNSFDRNSGSLFAFGEALRGLALRTPINVNDLAQIAELGGQLGIHTDSLVEFTEIMAMLGVTTNMSATEAATGMARFANIMQTPQDEFDRLASVVVELGNNFATTESEILKFGTRIAGTMRAVGATEEETFALAAALTSLGVPAERGGSAIQKWMIIASKAAEGGGEKLEKFAEVAGMTADEFARLFQESPGEAFAAFVQGLDDINKSGGDLFGTLDALELKEVRMTQVLLSAAGGADLFTDALRDAGKEGEEVNAIYEEAALRFGTTESKIALLVNSFNDLRIAIGNALLSTGGLAFGLDVIKEFFQVIGDNLGTIRKLVTVMGLLVALRLGVAIGQWAISLKTAAVGFMGAAKSAQAMGGAARLAALGMVPLTVAMQGALGVAGLLAAIWVTQAINAAQLKAELKALMEEIEGGVDPLDAFAAKVKEAIGQKEIDLLHSLGFSIHDLTQFLMDGQPAASEMGQALAGLRDDLGKPVENGFGGLTTDAQKLLGVVNDTGDKVEGLFQERKNALRDAFIETGNAANFTVDQLDALAGRAITELSFGATDDDLLNWMKEATTQTRFLGDQFTLAEKQAMHLGFELSDNLKTSWRDALPPDDADKMIDDFFEANIDAAENFVVEMAEAFAEVGEVVRGGMPVWEEYHKAVLGSEDGPLSYDAALKAQKAFLEDTRDWIERMPDIMQMGASADTVSWIESLEPPIRGAIGRLNDAQLEELIAGANANFEELNRLHNLRWMQIYPDNANLAFGAMVGQLAGRVGEMLLPGDLAGQAFVEGLMAMMATLPTDSRNEFIGYLQDLFSNEAWMNANGFDTADEWIVGLMQALAGLSARVNPIIVDESDKVKRKILDQYEVASPSKWFVRLGESFTEGLAQGIEGMSTAVDFSPSVMMPSMTPGMGAMSTINNQRTSSYNLTVNGGADSSNIRAEAQTLLTLLTIVGGVEQGAGR